MPAEKTLDDVLFDLHRYLQMPNPGTVTWWTRTYPQFADEIRAHAVDILDMENRADAADYELFRLATEG